MRHHIMSPRRCSLPGAHQAMLLFNRVRPVIPVSHDPHVEFRLRLLPNANRTLVQVERPRPVRLIEAGRGRPVHILQRIEWMPIWKRRAVRTAIDQRLQFIDIGKLPSLILPFDRSQGLYPGCRSTQVGSLPPAEVRQSIDHLPLET
mgnify:CR=1 FL=1